MFDCIRCYSIQQRVNTRRLIIDFCPYWQSIFLVLVSGGYKVYLFIKPSLIETYSYEENAVWGVQRKNLGLFPAKSQEEINSQFVIADPAKKISNIDLSWYESKIAFAQEILALLAESNLLPNPCGESDSAKFKHWTVNKSHSGKGAFGG